MVVDTKVADRRTRTQGRKPTGSAVVDDSPIARLCVENGLKMTGQRRVIAHEIGRAHV